MVEGEQPTQEQKKELWERYGLKVELREDRFSSGLHNWELWTKDGKRIDNPQLDLNSLFEYAVDWDKVETVQFSYGDEGHHCWLYMKKPVGKPFHGNGETEATALFWALQQVKGG